MMVKRRLKVFRVVLNLRIKDSLSDYWSNTKVINNKLYAEPTSDLKLSINWMEINL